MPAQNHLINAQLPAQLPHVVRRPLEAIQRDALGRDTGRVGAAVAEHVWADDAVVLGEEEGDLIAPAEGEVGPAVDLCREGGSVGGEDIWGKKGERRGETRKIVDLMGPAGGTAWR